MLEYSIINTRPEHGPAVYDVVRSAYGVPLDVECEVCINGEHVREHVQRFPEGQFVAVVDNDGEEFVVGMAATMRTARPPTDPPLSWIDAIGSMGIGGHVPDGEWLYGVEHTVRAEYQGKGIGTRLYAARFELVKKLNLRGWYAGGMLMGYYRYRDQMTVPEYAEKVRGREIIDPTVTMQMNRGFEAWGAIENYVENEASNDSGMLIVWMNPDFKADD